jgi:glyceraldehyde 3-phosphate dehydrogenase
MIRLAINGFGRIGRAAFKVALSRASELEIVAVNDLTDNETLAHLLRYDTVYGRYGKEVTATAQGIIIDKREFPVYAEKDPMDLPWKSHRVDVVLECTGVFLKRETAKAHLQAGAKQVILSAPGKGDDIPTYVVGVNDDLVNPGTEPIISNASCTTNCIAPMTKVLHDAFGIKKALMSTVHGYTVDQNLVDGPHKDLRRARAAAMNIVPTTTGAAIAVTQTISELRGHFDGLAIRVPVAVGSLSDLTVLLKRKTSVEEVNEMFQRAAESEKLKGILKVTTEPIVSSDIIGTTASAIVDLFLTRVMDGDLVKVVGWYDNEWAYSHRLIDLAIAAGRRL